jgi:hypothetical protein
MAQDIGRRVPERAAQNQALWRELNERLDARVVRWPGLQEALQRVLCECSLAHCGESLGMTHAQYVDAHRTDAHFAVAPHHDDPEFERVVERHPTYWVVEKFKPLMRDGTLRPLA